MVVCAALFNIACLSPVKGWRSVDEDPEYNYICFGRHIPASRLASRSLSYPWLLTLDSRLVKSVVPPRTSVQVSVRPQYPISSLSWSRAVSYYESPSLTLSRRSELPPLTLSRRSESLL